MQTLVLLKHFGVLKIFAITTPVEHYIDVFYPKSVANIPIEEVAS
jgi:hypothetical protein